MHPLARARERQAAPERPVGVDRVFVVLKELARHPEGVALDELARTLALPKSSVHRALAALRRAHLAERDRPGRYRLGRLVRRTARTLTKATDLARELDRIGRQGYAPTMRRARRGILCIAFPVFLSSRTRPSGAISVAALAHRRRSLRSRPPRARCWR